MEKEAVYVIEVKEYSCWEATDQMGLSDYKMRHTMKILRDAFPNKKYRISEYTLRKVVVE